MALATLEVARSRGLEIPRDLSLISFDNTPIVRFTQPPLTAVDQPIAETVRSEEHTSELQSLMRISYAVFCLKKKSKKQSIFHNEKQTKIKEKQSDSHNT